MTANPSALAYARLSAKPDSSEDLTAESIDYQLDKARAYAPFAGLTIVEQVSDPDTSGRLVPLREREGGSKLLALVGRNKIKHVITYRLDRLFRSIEDGLPMMKRWQREGVTIHLIAEGGCALNTSTAWGRMMVGQRLLMAEFEADVTAERTKHAMTHHQAAGRRMSKIAPYGWRVDPDSKLNADSGLASGLVMDLEEQAIIQRIKMLATIGSGWRAICRVLNDEGLTHRGSTWQHCQIKRILRREQVAS